MKTLQVVIMVHHIRMSMSIKAGRRRRTVVAHDVKTSDVSTLHTQSYSGDTVPVQARMWLTYTRPDFPSVEVRRLK